MVREVKGIEKMSMLGAGRGARKRGHEIHVFTFSRVEYWVTFRDSPHQP